MSDLERLDEALAAGVVATSQHGEAVVVGASVFLSISAAARAYRDLLANPAHDKGRTCERTEEVLEHYRKRALSAEKLAIRIGRGKPEEEMDFPEAWTISQSVPPEEHNPKCSTAQTGGAILCDCEVLTQHPRYIEDYGADPTTEEER